MTDGAETIKELKAAILAIEWEITDEAMDNLAQAIVPLQSRWAGQRPLLVCLQVIGTLGQYIKKARERAHKDAIKLLHSVYTTLETVVVSEALSSAEKVALVRDEVAKYNALKEKIARPRQEKAAEAEPEPASPSSPEAAAGGGGSTMRSLMDEKEDSSSDVAFNAMLQGMVGEEERREAPAPPPMPAMPSASQSPDAKEIMLDRIDDEVFPEADNLLDDFFGGEEAASSVEEEAAEPSEEEAGEEESVEVDLGNFAAEASEQADEGAGAAGSEETEEEDVETERLGELLDQLGSEVKGETLAALTAEIEQLRGRYAQHYSLQLFLGLIAAGARHLQRSPQIMADETLMLVQGNYDRLSHALFTMKPAKSLLADHLEAVDDYVAWNEALLASSASLSVPAAEAGEKESGPVQLTMEEGAVLSPDMESAVTDIVRREMERLREELLLELRNA